MAVKTDTLETVPPHVANAAGLGGKAILLINGEFRAETTRCTVFAIGSLVMRCENPPFEAGYGFVSPSAFASPASSILTGRSLGRVQFLKRCGTTA